MTLEGVLPVNKPQGLTSHDVVAKARKILGQKRIGHTGTLDPQVTGVLPLCLGRATRIVEYIQDLPKTYEAALRFGIATDTEDLSGTVTDRVDHVKLSEEQIRRALSAFEGDIEQIPPMYSAVKVQGQKLYELARIGKEIERKPRPVTIYRLELLETHLDRPQPEIKFRVECSKGTYIRTLCVDIGKTLGCPAVMAELVRTRTGQIELDQCVSLEQVAEALADGSLSEVLIPTDRAISNLAAVRIPSQLAAMALQGKHIAAESLAPGLPGQQDLVRLYSDEDRFLGIFRWENGMLVPVKVFS